MCINKSKPIKKSPPFKGDLEGHLPVWKVASPDRYEILKKFAQENRNNMTEAENALWLLLSNKKLGVKFYNVKIIFTRKAIEFYVLIMKKFYLI